MKIDGKVHCLFEQSGVFKNEFKKLGISAEDYDIQNNFRETDHVIDLFNEIKVAYRQQATGNRQQATGNRQQATIFDSINPCQDLVIAFFPCIYFETMSMMYFSFDSLNNKHKPNYERVVDALERLEKRTWFHSLLYKLVFLAWRKNFKLIIENPATQPNYIYGQQNFPKPTLIDKNRMRRGDYFVKPTAYWFFNCQPTHGFTYQNDKKQKIINDCKQGKEAGICSEERSMISPDYARNFICDFILGKVQYNIGQPQFDFGN